LVSQHGIKAKVKGRQAIWRSLPVGLFDDNIATVISPKGIWKNSISKKQQNSTQVIDPEPIAYKAYTCL